MVPPLLRQALPSLKIVNADIRRSILWAFPFRCEADPLSDRKDCFHPALLRHSHPLSLSESPASVYSFFSSLFSDNDLIIDVPSLFVKNLREVFCSPMQNHVFFHSRSTSPIRLIPTSILSSLRFAKLRRIWRFSSPLMSY